MLPDNPSLLRENPYVGPRTFDTSESHLFFGRDREARELLSTVISQRLVLFYAQSGAGKSSLVNTRLLPGLREEGFRTLPVCRVGGELPRGVSGVENIFVFNLLLKLDESASAPEALVPLTIADFLKARKADSPAAETDDADEEVEPARVLVIDQFEEILTTNLDRWKEREDFFKQLRRVLLTDPLLWLVLVMREDYVAALDPYARLLPGRLRIRFYMQRMMADGARQAIEEPAARQGCAFAPGVAESLVDNLRQIRVEGRDEPLKGQFVEPVHLQLVCYQLWDNLRSKDQCPDAITQEDLQELGDVDTALSQFYLTAVRQTLEDVGGSEMELHQWFQKKLITEAGTRGTVHRGADTTGGLANRVVDSLAERFILRPEVRAGGTWYELAHDRFVEPIFKANQEWWRGQSALIQAVRDWEQTEKSPQYLYTGPQLERALASVDSTVLDPIVHEFLNASEEADHAQRREILVAKRLRRLTSWLVVVIGGVTTCFLFLLVVLSSMAGSGGQSAGESLAGCGCLTLIALLGAGLSWLGLVIFRRMRADRSAKASQLRIFVRKLQRETWRPLETPDGGAG